MLDPYAFIDEFADHIFLIHGKDTKLFQDRLADEGILGKWWEYCLPGKGELNWKKLLAALEKYNFTGSIFIESEDESSSSPVNLEKKLDGIIHARSFLETN